MIKKYLMVLGCVFLFGSFSVELRAETVATFTQGMSTKPGFFTVFYQPEKAKVFLQIEAFEQDFIFLSSLSHGLGSNDIGLDRGLLGATRLVYFKPAGDRVLLIQRNTDYRANSQNAAERQSIQEAFAESVLAGFDRVAGDDNKVLIDITPLLFQDLMNVGERIKQRKQGSFSLNKSLSMVDESVVKSFPKNTELQSLVTFTGTGAGNFLKSVSPDEHSFSLKQRASFIKLPENNYVPRPFHPFSGFWSQVYFDYAVPLTANRTKRIIPRHHLEKKNPELEVSEAVNPIVYYVDPGAPEPVLSALIDGGKWWNEAFEAAGFKNAFQIKVMPDGVDPMDVRYNVIQWVHRATRGWSYGASVVDPRTGEILKGHVTLGSLRVRQDLLIAQGLTGPFFGNYNQAQEVEMALARIRQLSAHEIGHTLGLAHNFAASVNERASVMDYPHPLVTLDGENSIDLSQAYATGIGRWDIQAIKYGYSVFKDDELEALARIVKESKAAQLQFISDPDARPAGGVHDKAHLWDNGGGAADELTRVIRVREQALARFSEKVIPLGTPYSQLEEVLVPIYNLHRYQVEAAVKLIGGINYQYAIRGEDDFIQRRVSKSEQEKSLNILLQTLTPEFLTLRSDLVALIPPKAYGYQKTRESFTGKTGLTLDPLSIAESSAGHSLKLLLNSQRMTRVAQQQASDGLSLPMLLKKMTEQLLQEKKVEINDLHIQMRVANVYLNELLRSLANHDSPIEVKASVLVELDNITNWLRDQVEDLDSSDGYYGFYKSLLMLVKQKLESEQQNHETVILPPGSPIG